MTVATAGATLHAAGHLVPVPEWAPSLKIALGFVEWEVLKKAPQIADTFDKAGKGVGRLWDNLDQGVRVACADFIERTSPFRAYVVTHEALLRELAMSSPKLGWMTRYIDFIVQSEKRFSS